MKDKGVLVKNIIADNNLSVIYGDTGLDRVVLEDMICRPGMELSGYLDFYEPQRIVLLGTKETTFLKTLDLKTQKERVNNIFNLEPPLFVISKNVVLPDYFIELAKKYKIAIVKSDLSTTATSSKLYTYLQETLAARISLHATFLDIHGLGTLIMGHSGIGKSETALDLIKRGHQLISDDLVEIFEKEPGNLIGTAPDILKRYMEIRGIGIVDVVHMFGAAAYRPKKNVKLVIELEAWDKDKYYDRLGLKQEKIKFFDTEITKMIIPVLPGRNVALLVESAVLNEKLRIYNNYNDAKTFVEAVNNKARGEK